MHSAFALAQRKIAPNQIGKAALDYRNYGNTFIALHPFLQIEGYDPLEVGYGPYSIDTIGKVGGQAPIAVLLGREKFVTRIDEEKERLFCRLERLMKNKAKMVAWKEVQSACRLPGLSSIQRALASIGNGSTDPSDAVALEKILRFCDGEHVFLPTSGHVQPGMERSIAAAFKSAGKTELIASRMISRFSAAISVELLDAVEPIGSALNSAATPDLRSVHDVQVLRAAAGGMAMLSDDGDFYSADDRRSRNRFV